MRKKLYYCCNCKECKKIRKIYKKMTKIYFKGKSPLWFNDWYKETTEKNIEYIKAYDIEKV